jgi:hypothetical protein
MKFKFHFDAADPKQDAAESAFFSRQLEHIRPKIYEVKYPALKGRLVVPKIAEPIHPGAETYTYRSYARVGKARIGSDYSTDGPRADIYGSETTQKIRGLQNSYGYSIQEARAAMLAGLPLSAKKAKAARDVIETDIDTLIWDGKADIGLTGFLGLSDVTTYTVPDGAGGKTWEVKTSDEIVADLTGIGDKIVSDTDEQERPDTLLLPLTSYQLIASRRMGDGDSTTILKHFLAVSEHIKRVISSSKCETAGGSSDKRMVAYPFDPEKVGVIISQEFEQLAPQQRGYEVVTQCHARCGGVIAPYPKSVAYGDGI